MQAALKVLFQINAHYKDSRNHSHRSKIRNHAINLKVYQLFIYLINSRHITTKHIPRAKLSKSFQLLIACETRHEEQKGARQSFNGFAIIHWSNQMEIAVLVRTQL